MPYTTFVDAATVVMAPFNAFALKGNSIATGLRPYVLLGLTIVIMAHSLRLMLSKSPGTVVMEVFARVGRVVLCFGCALYAGSHMIHFDGVIAELQFYLAELFSSESNLSNTYQWKQELTIFKAIDTAIEPFLAKMPDVAKLAMTQKKIASDTPDLLGVLMMTSATLSSSATLAFAASIALMVLYFRIALTVCLGLLPLFLIFLAFQTTSRMFHSWLATTISYLFSAGIAAIPVGIALTQLEKIGTAYAAAISNAGTGDAAGIDFITTPLLAMLTVGMMGYMAARIPPLVSRLVGGFVSGASMGEGGHMLGATRQSMGMSMNTLGAGAGAAGQAMARNSKGQFLSRQQAASPMQAISDGLDRTAKSVLAAKNDWMAAYGVKTGATKTGQTNRRAPQQTIADRQHNPGLTPLPKGAAKRS